MSSPPPKRRQRTLSVTTVGQSTNIRLEPHAVSRSKRAQLLGADSQFRGCTLWFTGLSGAGKTTISFAVEAELTRRGIPCYGLDGDNCRGGITKDLGFSEHDRTENIRRVAEVAKLFADGGIVALCSFISPLRHDRAEARSIHQTAELPFYECYVATPLAECESRDVKGLYKLARTGAIKNFTGIGAPYEVPRHPEIVVGADGSSVDCIVDQVVRFLEDKKIVPARDSIISCFTSCASLADRTAEAMAHVKLPVDEITVQWIQVIAEGWASPLDGFMRERDFLQAIHFGPRSADGSLSIAIICPCDAQQKAAIETAQDGVCLMHNGRAVAVLQDPEVFDAIQAERCARQWGAGCESIEHPARKHILRHGDFNVGGQLEVLEKIAWNDGFDGYRKTPLELRGMFNKMGTDAVVAFQPNTDNMTKEDDVKLLRDASRQLRARGFHKPALLLHPVAGCCPAVSEDRGPARALSALMQHCNYLLSNVADVFDASRTVLAIFPAPLLHAGPTEMLWHARARALAGATFYAIAKCSPGAALNRGQGARYQPHHGAALLAMAPGLDGIEALLCSCA